MTACISIGGFKKIATIAYKTNCRVKLLKRHGCPFFIHKHRKRYAFLAGICLFAAILFVMSSFIWGIEIKGNEQISKETIQNALTQAGLKIGMLTGRVDAEAVKNTMMLNVPELGWIGLSVTGTKAVVEIRERKPKPFIADKNKAYNIKAKYDGIITTLDAKQGASLVKEGDVVKAGQLLVSGILDSKVTGVRYVSADADVGMKTWREATAEAVPYIEESIRTGRDKSKHIIQIFGHNINLFLDDRVYFDTFDRVSEVKQPAVFENFLLPFSFHYDKFYETEIVKQEISPEQAYNNCVELLRLNLKEKLEDDTIILGEDIATRTDEQGRLFVTLTYECADKAVIMEEITYGASGENAGS